MKNLRETGHKKLSLKLPGKIKELVIAQDWQQLDSYLAQLIRPSGIVFRALTPFAQFQSIEYITNIREAQNEWEEDGIWHDDGSRVLAFSLSLNLDPQNTKGGEVAFRKKGATEVILLPIQQYGTLIVFATGVWGWEHKVHQVTQGQRIVMAGWCT